MKLSQLLEAPPDFGNREISTFGSSFGTYSTETIDREFEIIARVKREDSEYWVLLKKNKSFAVLGYLVKRDETEVGVKIVGQIDFKADLDLSFFTDIKIKAPNELQVDGVEIQDKKRMANFGTSLYFALAQFGYVLISDTFHYIGGQALWKRVAKDAARENCAVLVIGDGEPLMADGEPIEYNGQNIPDSELWAGTDVPVKERKRHVLFVLKKK